MKTKKLFEDLEVDITQMKYWLKGKGWL